MGIMSKFLNKTLSNSYIIEKPIGVRSMERAECIECQEKEATYFWGGYFCESCLHDFLKEKEE